MKFFCSFGLKHQRDDNLKAPNNYWRKLLTVAYVMYVRCKYVDWIHLAQYRVNCWGVSKTTMSILYIGIAKRLSVS